MTLVALTIMSSVLVTNIYRNNISCRIFLRSQRENKIDAGKAKYEDCDGRVDIAPIESNTDARCQLFAQRLDRILFSVWFILYTISCIILLLVISL